MEATFGSREEARDAVEAAPFACGIMFDVTSEHCAGMTAQIVVACTADRKRGRRVCTKASEVAAFVAEFGR